MRLPVRRALERLLALFLVASLVMPMGALHAREAADDACVVVVAHDASAHRLQSADGSADAHGEHCFICHWSQSLRLMRQTEAVGVAAPSGRRVLSPTGEHGSPALLDARHAGRAPPA